MGKSTPRSKPSQIFGVAGDGAGGNPEALREAREKRLEAIRQVLEGRLRCSALKLVLALFDDEVEGLCGPAFSRKEEHQLHRGGSESRAGIYLEGQRARLRRPRVQGSQGEVPLESYLALQDFDVLSEQVKRQLIRGISTRNYEGAIREIEGGLGLKRTSVSRAFIRASQKDLELLNGRDLSGHRWVAVFVDALEFHGIVLVVALGVTLEGRKVILGLREGSTENERVCLDLLGSLPDRGFQLEERILAVMDGGKGIHSAIKKLWGERVLIQRCLVHKKRNVLDYLPKTHHAEAKRRMNAAWGLANYEAAKEELEKVSRWLEGLAPGAAASLREGFEETLTLHKLGVSAILRKTFSTTNPLESVFSIVRERSGRVKHWRRGAGQAARWSASCLLVAEKRLRRVRGCQYLGILSEALKKAVAC
jgi:transposase-like protein